MKIVCIGGGPAGITLAIALKLQTPDHQVTVYERHQPDDDYGWGVVLSDQTLQMLDGHDPKMAAALRAAVVRWDDVDVWLRGQRYRSGGHGFVGIGRALMMRILYDRARELGVDIVFGAEGGIEAVVAEQADVIVGADGLNSAMRTADPEGFGCDIDLRPNKYIWLGTAAPFHKTFTFIFAETVHGVMMAHAYPFGATASTFIVECTPEVYARAGFEHMTPAQSAAACSGYFADYLEGQDLQCRGADTPAGGWMNFPRVRCRHWSKGNVVLIGDAAHTAHFSIGSGTRMAMEDAFCLAEVLTTAEQTGQAVGAALRTYQVIREVEVLRLQSAARNAMEWFENAPQRYYGQLPPLQFVYSLLTRSQRVSHENLRLRDPHWLAGLERDFAAHAAKNAGSEASEVEGVPPMFTPYRLRGMVLQNRIAVSPMCMYSAEDGTVGDWHLVHYGARAGGGAGLLFTEMTDVSRLGRITTGCAGLYKDEHVSAWARIVEYVHAHTSAKIAVQLSHAGRKGSTKRAWEGIDQPREHDNWPLLAPSVIKWDAANQTPRAMTREDMQRVAEEFVAATLRAEVAGFDMVELHAAHGYLLSSFITPLSNQREDDYGGSLENRLRFPLEVFEKMRAVWPDEKPMSVRLSATDWNAGGVDPDEAVLIAQAFQAAGADIIDVSAGQTVPAAQAAPVYGRMFQTPLSDKIRNEGQMATMAVGNIYEADQVNSILAAGRADLVLIGRPHLMDPNWTLRAAAAASYRGAGVSIPPQYQTAFDQLEAQLKRAADGDDPDGNVKV